MSLAGGDGAARVAGHWVAYHLWDHGSRDELLRAAVAPLVDRLLSRGLADRFFFVRYDLGGPHVRLRLRSLATDAALLEVEVRSAMCEHFLRLPPADPLPPEVVRQRNRAILAADPEAGDDEVIADRTVHPAPYVEEERRYGGAEALRRSHELFALSSSVALDALAAAGQAGRPQWLVACFRLLLAQACGWAENRKELRATVAWTGQGDAGFRAPRRRAEELFRRDPEPIVSLVSDCLRKLGDGGLGAAQRLAGGAFRLRRALRDLAVTEEERVGSSQLHMTANRLGLGNAEEVYISRLLESVLGGSELETLELPALAIGEPAGLERWVDRTLEARIGPTEISADCIPAGNGVSG